MWKQQELSRLVGLDKNVEVQVLINKSNMYWLPVGINNLTWVAIFSQTTLHKSIIDQINWLGFT